MNETTLQAILGELSTAFQTRDLDGLLALFSTSSTATYAGSEADETATGAAALRRLFARLLDRDAIYSFHFPHLIYSEASGLVWVLGDGEGVETRLNHAAQVFAYRITGVLVQEEARWRWALLAGSEPTPPLLERGDTDSGE